MANSKEYVPAALCHIATHTNVTVLTGAFRADRLKAMIDGQFGLDVQLSLIEASLNYMVDLDLAKRFEDNFTAPYYLIDEVSWLDHYNAQNDSTSAFTKARLLGSSWIKEALEGLIERQGSDNSFLDISVPASDRLVSFTDNERKVLLGPLEKVSKELQSSNSVREELGEDADRVTAEIEAGVVLVKAGRTRLSALIAVLLKPLKYLSEKFSGAAIGTLATELVKAMLKLL